MVHPSTPFTDTLAFTAPHNLETGDEVYYFVPTGSTGITGLTSGAKYTVFKVDDTHIKLQSQALVSVSVNGSSVDTVANPNYIEAANTFANGDLVTYHAPPPLSTFSSFQVDQTFNANNNPAYTPTNNNQIFFAYDSTGDPDHVPAGFGFAAGKALVYNVSGGPAIGNLTPGGTYYLITTGDPLQIKLATNYCRAVGINPGPGGVCESGPGGIGGNDIGPAGQGAFIIPIDLIPDKSTGVTTVTQAVLLGSTLNVASTDGFNNSGTFFVSGIAGVCTYARQDRDLVHRDRWLCGHACGWRLGHGHEPDRAAHPERRQ